MQRIPYFCLFIIAFLLIACSDPSVTPASTQPTAQPTSKPATHMTPNPPSTSTPKPAVITPILGAPLSAFLTKYGTPNDHTDTKTGSYHFLRHTGSNIDGLIIVVDAATKRVNNVNVNASDNGPGWTAQEANDACSPFFPPDATYQRNVTLPNGNGIDAFYFAPSLASVFPASDFQDAQQNSVRAGSFDVQYLLKSNTEEKIVSCNILPGMSQTQ